LGTGALTKAGPFATPEDWAAWLAAHHSSETEVWLMYHKKGGAPSITWSQAVIEALAWGWIDGIRKTVDETRWQQRFTPRKPGSSWSRINCAHAEGLIATGRMQPPGLAQVNAARSDGRWDAAYSGGKGADIPPDFMQALAAAPPVAQSNFNLLGSRARYTIYYRLTTAKRAETRLKRIQGFVAQLIQGPAIS
jgi:uncharacterized protein YdeI (YjbR/CyaY-like superfamily)